MYSNTLVEGSAVRGATRPALARLPSALVASLLFGLVCASCAAFGLCDRGDCAGPEPFVYVPGGYVPGGERSGAALDEEALLRAWQPVFAIARGGCTCNRIGTPVIEERLLGVHAAVDPHEPAVFAAVRRDHVGSTPVLQLLYRVHFTRMPLTALFVEMHRNAGVLAIVTLREADRAPLLFTTTQTCGCYSAVLPTDLFPRAALPPDWPEDRVAVSGESLPAVLRPADPGRTRFVVTLSPRSHRVEDVRTLAEPPPGRRVPLPLRAADELHRLPVRFSDGETRSFYYERGPLEGHVRGAWSPLEGLTLGLVLLDPLLGMDKEFGAAEETGTRFYTSLLPWRRTASRLDRLDPYLRWLGFRLDAPGRS